MLKKSFLIPILSLLSSSLFFSLGCKKECVLPAPIVTISDITPTSAVASWNVIADAVNYEVSLFNASNVMVGSPQSTTSTQLQFVSLTPNTSYVVKVTARCKKDDKLSMNTGQVSFQTNAPPTCNLPAPTNIRDTLVSANMATVKWNAVPGAKNYKVTLINLTTGLTVSTTSVVDPKVLFTGLISTNVYKVEIRAVCMNDEESPIKGEFELKPIIIDDDVVMRVSYDCNKRNGPFSIIDSGVSYLYTSNTGTFYIKASDGNSMNDKEFLVMYELGTDGRKRASLKAKCTNPNYVLPTQNGSDFTHPFGAGQVRLSLYKDGFIISAPSVITLQYN